MEVPCHQRDVALSHHRWVSGVRESLAPFYLVCFHYKGQKSTTKNGLSVIKKEYSLTSSIYQTNTNIILILISLNNKERMNE